MEEKEKADIEAQNFKYKLEISLDDEDKQVPITVAPVEHVSLDETSIIEDPLLLEKNLLAKPEIQKSFSSLYLNVDTYRDEALTYTVSLLIRRFALAIIISAFSKSFFQIHFTMLLSVAQILYLTLTMPMEKKLDNVVIIVNEWLVYACGVNLLLFTEYVQDPNIRWSCGYSFMFFVLLCVVFNISIALFNELKPVVESLKVKFAAWKAKKALIAASNSKKSQTPSDKNAASVQEEVELTPQPKIEVQ